MRSTVAVFELAADGTAVPGPTLDLEGVDHDALRVAAATALTARYARVRSLAFTPTGLVAYVVPHVR
jgi:hypothetical protein